MRTLPTALVLTLSGLCSVALAAPRPEVALATKVLEVQRKAIEKHDAGAFTDTFAGQVLVVFPGAKQVTDDTDTLKQYFTDTFADSGSKADGAKWANVKTVATGGGAIVTAELTVSWSGGDAPTTYRVTELLVPSPEGGALGVMSAHVSISVPEADAVNHLTDFKYVPDEMPGRPGDDSLVSPAALAAHVFTDPNVSVLGTETPEKAFGTDAAKKLLGKWKGLKLKVVGKAVSGAQPGDGSLVYAGANVNLTTGKGKLPFRVTVYGVQNPQDGTILPVAVHYSSPAY